MERKRPSIAVVIPMYNSAEYINRALGSVYQQTAAADEVIVVDDGSTDNSVEVIIQTFPKVRVVSQNNKGVGGARNAGIEAAESDWIAFLDSDDFWLPNHLEVAGRLLRKFSDARLVSTSFVRWNPVNPIKIQQRPIKDQKVDFFKVQFLGTGKINSSTALVHKRAFESAGKFSGLRIHEDTDMWERLALNHTFACTTEVTAIYVITENSAMSLHNRELSLAQSDLSNLLYVSRNTRLESETTDSKTLTRYQNHLYWANVKTLLLYGRSRTGKELATQIKGSMRFNERIGVLIVASCPVQLLNTLSNGRNFWKKISAKSAPGN